MTATALESTITAVWRKLLATPEVGLDANFFDLGGDSMVMIRVHSALQEALGTTIPIIDLFRYPTVRALASALNSEESAAASYLQLLRGKEANPLRVAVLNPADAYLDRATKQRAAHALLRDRAGHDPSS
jgi:acyl carrier protein